MQSTRPLQKDTFGQYPLENMFEYNNKLLDLQPKVTEEDVKNMTEEQKTEMLLKLLANK